MLTDIACKRAKSREKAYKLYDAGGLYLLVKPSGSKLWQLKYSFEKHERTYSIGQYGEPPNVTLAEARKERDRAKVLVKSGRDPVAARRDARLQEAGLNSARLKEVCIEWLELNARRWNDGHAAHIRRQFEADIFPIAGDVPIHLITNKVVMKILTPIFQRGAVETSHRIHQYLSRVFAMARGKDLVPPGFDPAGPDILNALPLLPPEQAHPALLTVPELRVMLAESAAYHCHPTTKLAVRFQALTAVRATTLISARWDHMKDLDGDDPSWDIPAELMKGKKRQRRPFKIPLCRQAVETLAALREINGHFPFVFPSDIRPETNCLSNNTVTFHLYDIGYKGKHCQHGFRASFSTIMNERHPELRHVIDFAIGHAMKDKVEAAYNRAGYWDVRKRIHQEYADLILVEAPPARSLLFGLRH